LKREAWRRRGGDRGPCDVRPPRAGPTNPRGRYARLALQARQVPREVLLEGFGRAHGVLSRAARFRERLCHACLANHREAAVRRVEGCTGGAVLGTRSPNFAFHPFSEVGMRNLALKTHTVPRRSVRLRPR
jgi:hypothetical protein